MKTQINSVEDFFSHAGGAVHVAAALDLNQWTVERWKKCGIPGKHWAKLVKSYDISPEVIMAISNKAVSTYRARLKAR